LLLMDEPLGALDQEIRVQMQEEIRRIHRELKPTVVYVTHDKNEAFALSDRIGIMRAARLVALDAPDALYHAPATAFVASFFGGHQLLDVDLLAVNREKGTANVRLGSIEASVMLGAVVPNGTPMALAVPSEVVTIGQAESEAVTVTGEVADIVHMGSTTHVYCTTELGGQRIVAELRSDKTGTWKIGDPVSLAIDTAGARLVPRDESARDKVAPRKESE
jgi:putative spermidine/putrescine transport system ATP-binding protein